jgi:hypothetical protein
MRGFGSIVGISLHTVSHVAKDRSHGSGVASQFVGNDPQWFGTLAAQQPSKDDAVDEQRLASPFVLQRGFALCQVAQIDNALLSNRRGEIARFCSAAGSDCEDVLKTPLLLLR